MTSEVSHYLDAFRMRWYRYVVNWSLKDQVKAASALRDQAFVWRRVVSRTWFEAEWTTWKRWLLGAGAIGAVLFLAARLRRGGGWIALRPFPRSSRRLRAYEEMLRRLARQALIPGRSETAREFAARAGRAVPELSAPLREITEVYERVRFGGEMIPAGEDKRLLAWVNSLPIRRRGVAFLRG